MPNLFISYRREDSAAYAGRLYDRLNAHFGADSVFMDINTLEPGIDFVEVIEHAMSQCDILLVLIGPGWLSVADAMGQRRLDNPKDFVRLEIQVGLERDIRVIPVLVGDATMPDSPDLPEALIKLARRNALELSDIRWHADVDKLIGIVEKLSAATQHRVEEERQQREPAATAQRRAGDEQQKREEAEATSRRIKEEQQRREQADPVLKTSIHRAWYWILGIIGGLFLILGIPILLVRMLVIDAGNLIYIPPTIVIYLGLAFILWAVQRHRDRKNVKG